MINIRHTKDEDDKTLTLPTKADYQRLIQEAEAQAKATAEKTKAATPVWYYVSGAILLIFVVLVAAQYI